MTFHGIDAWWWPFLFILIAGWLATDAWRYLGVYFGGRIDENSEVLVLVRTVATALVAGVIGNLVFFAGGALGEVSLWLRGGALVIGFAAYLALGQRMLVGIAVAEAVLLIGLVLA